MDCRLEHLDDDATLDINNKRNVLGTKGQIFVYQPGTSSRHERESVVNMVMVVM